MREYKKEEIKKINQPNLIKALETIKSKLDGEDHIYQTREAINELIKEIKEL